MKELPAILDALDKVRDAQRHAVLATLVGVQGSSYRRPGARMLVLNDRHVGAISGGCLENEIVQQARTQQPGQPPRVIRYATGEAGEAIVGFGMGCKGVLSILLESIDPASEPLHLRFLRDCLISGQTGVIATVCATEGTVSTQIGDRIMLRDGAVASSGQWSDDVSYLVMEDMLASIDGGRTHTRTFETCEGRLDVFVEVVRPPLRLAIFGAGDNTLPVVRLAKELGWHVTVCDRRENLATTQRFPEADVVLSCPLPQIPRRLPLESHLAAIIMMHNYPDDLVLLRMLLPRSLRYLGILGARPRTRQLLDDLAKTGMVLSDEQLHRLHYPIGLNTGGDAPEEMALSIIAEIQAVAHGRDGGFLRDRPGAIHESMPSEAARP